MTELERWMNDNPPLADALTAEENGWAKLLRYYLVNLNSGYYADYPKTPAELEN